MVRAYVASPLNAESAEEIRQNLVYARLCMLDSLGRGEAPYLSHLLYTQVWAETPTQREAGLAAGDAWREAADIVAVYTDLGITSGMQRAIDKAKPGTCVSRSLGNFSGRDVGVVRRILREQPLGNFASLATAGARP